MRRIGILAASALLAAAQSDEIRVSAHPYTPPPLRLAVQSDLVQLEVTVRDPRGHPVSGLKPSDFEVLDEGKPREIDAFSVSTRETAGPATPSAARAAAPARAPAEPAAPSRSTLLFFDDLHTPVSDLQRVQIAAKHFVRDGLGPGALAGVYASSEGLILDFTNDPDALTAAIGKLRPHPRISGNGLQSCPRMTPYQAYLIDNNLDLSAFNAALDEMKLTARGPPAPREPTPTAPPFDRRRRRRGSRRAAIR
jgi:VWFA-related protein